MLGPHDDSPDDDLAHAVWAATGNTDPAPPGDVDSALRAVLEARHTRRPEPVKNRSYGWLYPAAAAALLLILGGVLRVRSFTSVRAQEFASAAGSQETITLRDGTHVILAPESHSHVPADFGTATRNVQLDGEAYFSVIHDIRHPFAVLANHITITDVGTEFDVRAYDDNIRVAVARGSVLVGAGRGTARRLGGSRTRPSSPFQNLPSLHEIPLSAGDMVTMDTLGPIVMHHADVAAATAWTQGGLAFEDAPLSDVLRDIARTFNLHITLADSTLGKKRITSAFGPEPVEEILDVVTLAVGAHYERVGQTVTVRRGIAPAREQPSPVPTPPPLNTAQASPHGE